MRLLLMGVAAISVLQLTDRGQDLAGLGLEEMSFADAVIRYDPPAGGDAAPVDPSYLDPSVALGRPSERFVSLGSGGVIELAFVDNVLTNSRDSEPDLYIDEVFGTAEQFYLAIRPTPDSAGLLRDKLDADGYIKIGSFRGEPSNRHFITLIDLDQFLPDLNLRF